MSLLMKIIRAIKFEHQIAIDGRRVARRIIACDAARHALDHRRRDFLSVVLCRRDLSGRPLFFADRVAGGNRQPRGERPRALFLIGAGTTLFTGLGVWFSGLRQLPIGFAAAGVTYGVGKLIGVAITG
jgi:hypothetical protein